MIPTRDVIVPGRGYSAIRTSLVPPERFLELGLEAGPDLKVKIWRREVFATTRFFDSAETNGRLKECVTAVGGVSSV